MNKTIVNSKIPSCLEIVLLYLKFRKDGNTVDKEDICDYCYILLDVFNDTIHSVEDVFPEYRCLYILSFIYRLS